MNAFNRLFLVAWVVVLVFGLVIVNAQPQSVEAIQRRAFLTAAACGWHPGIDQWVFDKIDRTDPDWEAAFQRPTGALHPVLRATDGRPDPDGRRQFRSRTGDSTTCRCVGDAGWISASEAECGYQARGHFEQELGD